MQHPFITALVLAFLATCAAEFGCLVRSAALVLSSKIPLAVVIGTVVANIVLLLPIVIFGDRLLHMFPAAVTAHADTFAGVLFILIGIWMLFGSKH